MPVMRIEGTGSALLRAQGFCPGPHVYGLGAPRWRQGRQLGRRNARMAAMESSCVVIV